MIFKKDELLFCLDVVKKALPTKAALPVLENIYFKCADGVAQFTAFNLEMEITCRMDHEDAPGIELLLPPAIVDVVRHLPGRSVAIDIDTDVKDIRISSGEASYNLHGANAAEYPKLEVTDDAITILVSGEELKRALKQVVFAASTDIGRPVFTGVLFAFEESTLVVIASDTYRVAMADVQIPNCPIKEKLLIPAKTIKELIKLPIDDDQQISLSVCRSQVTFNLGDIMLTAKTLDEKFPVLNDIIPSDYKTRLEIPRQEFGDAVTRAALLATGENRAISFEVNGSGLSISVNSEMGAMKEPLSVDSEGEELSIYLNAKFLLEMIKTVGYEKVAAEFNGPNGPVIFRPADDNGYLYLVLPIKMQEAGE